VTHKQGQRAAIYYVAEHINTWDSAKQVENAEIGVRIVIWRKEGRIGVWGYRHVSLHIHYF